MAIVDLKNGETYLGKVSNTSADSIWLNDFNFGRFAISKKKVKHVEKVYTNTSVIISLGANSNYRGKIKSIDGGKVRFKANNKTIDVALRDIKNIEVIEASGPNIANPNSTRYFFAPSAIPLQKGSGYYQNAYILSNSVSFGITDKFTLGGGVIIPLLFYTTPKISWKLGDKVYLGAGMIAATTIIPDLIISGGIPYGIFTFGNTEDNITLGTGYGLLWNDGDFKDSGKPIVTLNAMKRLNDRFHLVSENWLLAFVTESEYLISEGYYDTKGGYVPSEYGTKEITETYAALSLGLRIKVGKKSTFDFAPVYIIGDNSNGVIIPYLDLTYRF